MAPNRLIHEKSPYLLQHAHNPVDWHPWADETFQRAKKENKPIFLSIGYATCHWCHVMEKESFEDEEAAGYLNDTFISIKVDREERPDIDAVYMAACQMLTGSGGWPLNICLTPDKKPFFAGTYFPKRARFGRSGLIELCRAVKKQWADHPDTIHHSAAEIARNLDRAFDYTPSGPPDESLLDEAYTRIGKGFDPQSGGFESAPKFPMPHRLLFLLRYHHRTGKTAALQMVEKTLTAMRLGGIWDHVGFGFHRYSTDVNWLLPHFEKMLYDQALIALAYLDAYQITRNPLYSRTAEEIFSYVLRDMTSRQGGFYSAEDADSEGEEGKFYVWTLDDFKGVLGQAAQRWEKILRVSPEGNFADEASRMKTGANILHLTALLDQWAQKLGLTPEELEAEWEQVREKLFLDREKRIHPLKDDKILADWNGLMIAALAAGARVLDNAEYADAARKAAAFVLDHMVDDSGRLFHRYRDGELAIPAQASDYAFLIHGLIALYQATFDLSHLEHAIGFQEQMMTDFWDADQGGFFSTATDHHELPVRPKDIHDSAIPSINSVAFSNLLWLSRLTGNPAWEDRADKLAQAISGTVKAHPSAFTYFLTALDFALSPGQDIVIAAASGAPSKANLLSALNANFSPNTVAWVKSDENAGRLAQLAGFTDGLEVVEGQTTAHLCKNGACTGSTTDIQAVLDGLLDSGR